MFLFSCSSYSIIKDKQYLLITPHFLPQIFQKKLLL